VTGDAAKAPRAWRKALSAFGNRSAITLFFFGFGCGLPFFLIGNTLAIWLRDSGWALGPIGLVSYLTFFYVFKFMWAPLLDTRRLPVFGRLGRRRGWLFAAQLAIAAGLAALAMTGPIGSVPLFLGLAGFTAFAGATQDTMVDAYRVEIAPVELQGALAATYTLGYRIGLQLCGGALVLYLADFAGWRTGYLCMAAFALVPAVATLFAPEPPSSQRIESEARLGVVEAYVKPFAEFFRRNGWLLGLVLLAFVGLYKLPDQMLSITGAFHRFQTLWRVDGHRRRLSRRHRRRRHRRAQVTADSGAGGGAVEPAVHPDVDASRGAVDVCRHHLGGQPVAGIRRNDSRRISFRAGRQALHGNPVRLAVLAGKLIGGFSGYIVEASSYTVFFVISSVSVIPTLLLLAWLWKRIAPPGDGNGSLAGR
jgi:MFS transporter, PAT family, beta-lactamase induction signal transducer AmpG